MAIPWRRSTISTLALAAFTLFNHVAAHVAAVALDPARDALSAAHVAAVALDPARDALSAACVLTQFLGVRFGDAASLTACLGADDAPVQGSVWQSVARGALGAWNAVMMALLADAVEARDGRRALGWTPAVSHGAGLAVLSYLAADWLGRLAPAAPEDMLTVPLIGLRISPAEPVIAAEALSAALLGLLFALVTLAALRRLQARVIARRTARFAVL